MRRVLLYRERLDLNSGAGQLLELQMRALREAAVPATLVCERGGLRFFLRTGVWPRRWSVEEVRRRREVVVDHGMRFPDADIVFVHNLATQASRYMRRPDPLLCAAEARFFGALRKDAIVVANSALVKDALLECFALPSQRVAVQHPGFRSDRYAAAHRISLRTQARRALGIADDAELVGFVTSGHFEKRGLDLFLEAAERISATRPGVHFLVVGSRALPDWARAHELVVTGRVSYRPKRARPEAWFAALDVFLYAARFEEFGMVVAEAQALGVPVITSRVVGAVEILAPPYARWLVDRPEPRLLAENTLALLDDERVRGELSAAGIVHSAAHDHRAYMRATVETVLRIAGSDKR